MEVCINHLSVLCRLFHPPEIFNNGCIKKVGLSSSAFDLYSRDARFESWSRNGQPILKLLTFFAVAPDEFRHSTMKWTTAVVSHFNSSSSSFSLGATVHDEPWPLLQLPEIVKSFSTAKAFHGVGP
jgi:hypothetical protein